MPARLVMVARSEIDSRGTRNVASTVYLGALQALIRVVNERSPDTTRSLLRSKRGVSRRSTQSTSYPQRADDLSPPQTDPAAPAAGSR